MRKLIVVIPVLCLHLLISSFTSIPVANSKLLPAPLSYTTTENAVSALYASLGLKELGLSEKIFTLAHKGYQKLLAKGVITEPAYLTICDLSQSSRNKRLYLIDMVNKEVIMNTWVAHGKKSGMEYAQRFSNRVSSQQSSLGFYITKTTYQGEHGLSLRVHGMEPGFNDKAYRRGIVVHGARYIGETKWGRSFGCPAVPASESKELINTIKEGTCLFIYHPTKTYLKGSKILNG